MRATFSGTIPDRIPFVPTIYEHAAALIQKTPSEVARDPALIVDAQLSAFEKYRHDLVTVGVDIYNVEAEALGCKIKYFESTDIPGIKEILLHEKERLHHLKVPDPECDGRMPVLLHAASKIRSEIGDKVFVAGTIVGPFTLAAIIRGIRGLLLDIYEDPFFFQRVLDFARQVGERYGKAMIVRGLGVAINESFSTTPFLSKQLYADLVFPVQRRIVRFFRDEGAENIGLIIGGDTAPFADFLVRTGTSILIADYNTDLEAYKAIAQRAGVVLRGNVNPSLLERASQEELLRVARCVLRHGKPGGRFLLGTGVVPYHTDPRNILALKALVEQEGTYSLQERRLGEGAGELFGNPSVFTRD
jgi:uroporphyrinogen decarboxylase